MVWARGCLEVDGSDVREVCSARFLVDGTLVRACVASACGVDRVDVNDRHWFKQDFWFRLYQLTASPIPSGVLEVEAVDVDALLWGCRDVVFQAFGDVVVEDHRVQSPSLVITCYLLCRNITTFNITVFSCFL